MWCLFVFVGFLDGDCGVYFFVCFLVFLFRGLPGFSKHLVHFCKKLMSIKIIDNFATSKIIICQIVKLRKWKLPMTSTK